MKKFIALALFSFVLAGCGETGDKVIKAAAQAVLEDENNQSQSSQQHNTESNTSAVQPQNVPKNNLEENVTENTLPPKPQQAQRAQQPSERVVRKRAWVITQQGSNVMVRRTPSRNASKVGYLYDTEEIWVIGETNKCEVINGIQGCWVKVMDVNGLTGYSFGGYLQY